MKNVEFKATKFEAIKGTACGENMFFFYYFLLGLFNVLAFGYQNLDPIIFLAIAVLVYFMSIFYDFIAF